MFIAALFIIARTWKQPRCPSADEWIRKLWYIYTMEYYSLKLPLPINYKIYNHPPSLTGLVGWPNEIKVKLLSMVLKGLYLR